MRAAGAATTGHAGPGAACRRSRSRWSRAISRSAPRRSASGLLLVDGLLDITGTFEFNGVVVASGGIRSPPAPGSTSRGASGSGSGASLVVDGDARVAARADAPRRGGRRCCGCPVAPSWPASAIRRERVPARRSRRMTSPRPGRRHERREHCSTCGPRSRCAGLPFDAPKTDRARSHSLESQRPGRDPARGGTCRR